MAKLRKILLIDDDGITCDLNKALLEAFSIDIEKLRIVVLGGYLDLESRLRLDNFDTRITAYLSQPLHKKAVQEVLLF